MTLTRDSGVNGVNVSEAGLTSPLDPYLIQLLTWLSAEPNGFSPKSGAADVAALFDWHPSFAAVLITSARVRGYFQPIWQTRGQRVQLSNKGQTWLDASDSGFTESHSDSSQTATAEPPG